MDKRYEVYQEGCGAAGWMNPDQRMAEQELKQCLHRVVFEGGVLRMHELQKPVNRELRDEFGRTFWQWTHKVPMKVSKCRGILYELRMEPMEAATIWYTRVFKMVTIRGVRSVSGWKVRMEHLPVREASWRFDRILQVVARDGADAAVRALMTSAYRFCQDLVRDYKREQKRREEPLKKRSLEDVPGILRDSFNAAPDRRYERRQSAELLIKCLNRCGLNEMAALVGDAQDATRREIAQRMALNCEDYICELLDDMSLIFGIDRMECRRLASDVIAKATGFNADAENEEAVSCLVAALYRQTSSSKRTKLRNMHHDMTHD